VNNIKELNIDTKPKSKQEIRKTIKNMKNGKAPDNITAELLQADMETTVNILHQLLYDYYLEYTASSRRMEDRASS
jgi:hypothetical protein